MLYEFKRGQNAVEATKNICSAKVEVAVNHSTVKLITVQQTDRSRNFVQAARTLMIKQSEVSLKPWIPKLCSNS